MKARKETLQMLLLDTINNHFFDNDGDVSLMLLLQRTNSSLQTFKV